MTINNRDKMTASMYLKIFILLLFLTFLTFVQPFIIPTDVSNTVGIQMLLSLSKAVLIISYYMHLKYESRLFKYIVYFAVITLSIFFIITATDAIFRNEPFDMFR